MYNKYKKHTGVALLTAIVVLVLFATLGYVAVNLLVSDVSIARDSLRSAQAFNLAESGIQYIFEDLSNDLFWNDNNNTSMTMAGGNCTIGYLERLLREATIKFTGEKEGVKRSIVTRLNFVRPFGYGLYVGGAIHEQNADFFETPAPENTQEGAAEFPTFDMAYYRSIADHVIDGNYTFESGTYSGLWFIDGSVDFEDNVIINGSVIATGNVDMNHCQHIMIDAYDDPYNGTRAKYASSAWSQSGLGSFAGSEVNNGDIETASFTTASSSSGAYLKLDAGAGQAREFVQFEVLFDTAQDYDDLNIQYSDNGSSWASVTIDTAGFVPGGNTSSKRYRYSWDSVGNHRYWRAVKNSSGDGGTYTESQFIAKLPDDISPFSNPALISNGNFTFQNADDITVIGLLYCGADLSGNLLIQQTQYINFVGISIVTGNFNAQQSEYISVLYQDTTDSNNIVIEVLEWRETD